MKTKRKLFIGDIVAPYGKVGAIGITGGERYFWFVDKHKCVAMMPASMFEEPEAWERERLSKMLKDNRT